MNRVAIIQARLGSTRLPGKCLLKLMGRTVIQHIIERIQAAKCIDQIILATTVNEEDQALVDVAHAMGLTVYRGSVNDVLDRFYQAAKMVNADIICRITADDPFKDPNIIDMIINQFIEGKYDYVSNTISPTYPEGLDIEVFSFAALEKAWREAHKPSEREHVTPYIWNNPQAFKLYNVKYAENISHLRWTLDTAPDWVFIQQVYEELYRSKEIFFMNDVLNLLRIRPELNDLNSGIVRNDGYLKSIAQEAQNKGSV